MSTPPPVELKETVHLPHTTFPIRAEWSVAEPQWRANAETHQWANAQRGPDAPSFVLHDGPPYPNGNIHLGHALNKVLKDIIVRSKRMMGYRTHYVPGWDCHGLPIETQVLKETKQRAADIVDIPAFRRQCQAFAERYVQTQADDFKRLGIWATWDTPYLTLNPEYEAAVVRLFGELAQHGAIYKGRKPIHWCMSCETALAEAEIEYDTHQSPALYVRFPMVSHHDAGVGEGGEEEGMLVWTTTPWTLPSNVALAVNPDLWYVLLPSPHGPLWVAEARVTEVSGLWDAHAPIPLARCQGGQLMGRIAEHPFESRQVPVIGASFVTDTDGSGTVHIAPGHGQDDHVVGMAHQLPVLMPINPKGCFEAGHQWEGMHVFKANEAIIALLASRGQLVHVGPITHSYPHCWRCKKPVIFRATPQWFVAMDVPLQPDGTTLRSRTLAAIDTTAFYPSWGKNRIRAMVESRPDWCISRQRYWGIPIPVVTCRTCGHSETVRFNGTIASKIATHGSTAWFEEGVTDWLPPDATCAQCGGRQFEKERDILDVWFESGASFASVLSSTETGGGADLILEGSDQHRGWFQSGLLLGQGARQLTPSRAILTHGFLVDDQGKKMSKSVGNVLSPAAIITEYGADVLRWWVASSDFKTDISVSKSILNQARDSFAKVRNTIRFLLANRADGTTPVEWVSEEVDQWVLHELSELVVSVQQAYIEYETHVVTHRVHDFCAVTLSAWYLDMVKDRLYCDRSDSPRRRSAQATMGILARQLAQLIAPILVVTSDSVAQQLGLAPHESIHLTDFPTPEYLNPVVASKWRHLLEVKELAYQSLEKLRQEKGIKRFLDAKVTIESPDPIAVDDLASVLIVSDATWVKGPRLSVNVSVADGEKCERCWKIKPLSPLTGTPHYVCDRCHEVVTSMGVFKG